MAGAVQFFGIDPVIKAYTLQQIDCWGLFQGKQLLTAGSGLDSLQQFLNMLSPGGSAAVYILKMYRGCEDPDTIDDSTPANASFNFKLLGEGAGMGGNGYGNNTTVLLARIAALEKEKAERDAEGEEETIKSALIGLLHEPEKIPHLIQGFKMLFGGAAPMQSLPVSVGNIPAVRAGADSQLISGTNEERLQRLSAAVSNLERNDPKILEHLEALAKLSNNNPTFFNMMITQLEKM